MMRMSGLLFLILFGFSGLRGVDTVQKTPSQPVGFEWYRDSTNYWPFEGVTGATVPDYRRGENDGKISGDFKVVPGIVGSAIQLPGRHSWIDFGQLRSSCLSDPGECSVGLSVAFWLRLPRFKPSTIIFQAGRHRYSRGCTVWTRQRDTNVVGISLNTRTERYSLEERWNAAHWTHVAFTWDATRSTLRVYFNCTLISTVRDSEPAEKDKSGKTLPLIWGASHGQRKFSTLQVDELAIWNKVLAKQDLCQIFKIRSVHGNYSNWSEFSSCSVTCGNGTRTRTRTCTSPTPEYRGRDCSGFGPSALTASCYAGPCPIDGGYSHWSEFSACDKSCGGGIRVRIRNCTKPAPRFGGLSCARLGPEQDTEECNTHFCPIHGGYSPWSAFTRCTLTCGNGTRRRSRTCSNPEPQHGGEGCGRFGPNVQSESCNPQRCPIDGQYTAWSEFSQCSQTCGNGTMQRTRNCTNPVPRFGGKNCSSFGAALEVVQCNVHPCPIQGGYSNWSDFTICSKPCGNGTSRRTRTCTNPGPRFGGENCSRLGLAEELRQCNTHPCPVDGGYSPWTAFSVCSKSCGYGEAIRTRNCTDPPPKFGGRNCSRLGASVEKKACNSFPCPVHGGYTNWSNFSDCTKSCGKGSTERRRNCSNPAPKYGGRNCSEFGAEVQIERCNIHPCPIDGGYSSWSNFTICSKTCGNGTGWRSRNCTNPFPRHRGLNCSRLGPAMEVRPCNVFPCPVHGGYTAWSRFSDCTKSCGNGTMQRTRNCTNPTPKHGGRNCSRFGFPIEVEFCNTHHCPIDGGYTPWSNFTHCSKSCGNGTQFRNRNCTNPEPRYGGSTCSRFGPRTETRHCNEHPCPISGGYTSWSGFGECSRSCGNGTRTRRRFCTNPRPRFGGENCSRFGGDEENLHCHLKPCPIPGGYGNWSNFTECSKSCGGGERERHRTCDNPVPQWGGESCKGPGFEKVSCNEFPCPVHGNYSAWTGFEPCTVTCAGGVRIRRRSCTRPPPAHGGRDCRGLGPAIEELVCNTQECPDIVFNVTVNLTAVTWNPSLENMESTLATFHATKIKLEVGNVMGKSAISSVDVHRFRKGSVLTDFTLSLLHKHYTGITALQRAINDERKLGLMSVAPVGYSLSSRDVPDRAPTLVGRNTSSTSIQLRWTTILPNHTNGDIQGYRLAYSKHGDQSAWVSALPRDALTWEVTKLEKFTTYDFVITGENRRGYGVDSNTVDIRTDEDKPSAGPVIIHAVNTSSSSLLIAWKPIPPQLVHGILLGYHVAYNIRDMKNTTSARGVQEANASTPSVLIQGLRKFTPYRVEVSGFTLKGAGPYSRSWDVVTDEDVPSKPPAGVTAHNTSSTSVEVTWQALPQEFVHGILLGYKVSYKGSHQKTWQENVVPRNVTGVVITNLAKFTRYTVQIQAFTRIGDGIPSKGKQVWTDEDKPNHNPENVTLVSTNSTEMFVEWMHIPGKHRNGILRGYRVFCRVNGSVDVWQEQAVRPAARSTLLSGLEKFVWYEVKVAGFTSKGLGPESPTVAQRTQEDVPSKSVFSIAVHNVSHTSIKVLWQHIPQASIHGILKGYRVFYWRANETQETAGETKDVTPQNTSTILSNLWIYTKYTIRVLGFTTVGEGNISKPIVVSTDEYTPSLPPSHVKAFNKTSPTAIRVSWKPIAEEFYVHGVLLGYRVAYRAVAVANESVMEKSEETVKTVGPRNLSLELVGLGAFTRYHIQVRAFTKIGDGVRSSITVAETCNCFPKLFTNWWSNAPYVDNPLSLNKTGMLPTILRNVVKTCCGECGAHGRTVIDFKRTASDARAKKSGLVDFQTHIGEGAELSFPVYGFMHQKYYMDIYGFVPIVQSPGVALITIGDEEGTAAMVLIRSLALCWPILFLSVIMLWMFGVLMWFLETPTNPENFPRNVILGSWEGIWWAFATMTTLGYGDRLPRNPLGRICCVVWITTGIVMVTCFNSTMTTVLTSTVLERELMLYGTEVGAIQNSSEYRLGIRKNARVNVKGKYANLEQVYSALTERQVQAILVDAFTVGSRKDLFEARRDLYVNKILDFSAAYGVVLAGEGNKLHKCFQSYINEQRSEVSQIISDNVQRIEVAKQSLSVERSQGLFDPSFPTYTKALIMSGMTLALLILLGAKVECAKKFCCLSVKSQEESSGRTVMTTEKLLQHKDDLKREMSLVVLEFKRNCQRVLYTLRQKHRRQLLQWIKLNNKSAMKPIHRAREKLLTWRDLDYTFDQVPDTKYYFDSKRNGTYKPTAQARAAFV